MMARCLLAALLWTAEGVFGIIRSPISRRILPLSAASMNSISQTLGLAIGWLMVACVALQAMVVAIKSALGRARWKQQYLAE